MFVRIQQVMFTGSFLKVEMKIAQIQHWSLSLFWIYDQLSHELHKKPMTPPLFKCMHLKTYILLLNISQCNLFN